MLGICAIYLKEQEALPGNRIVATVMSNLGLDRMLEPHGIEVLRAPVGDRYVLEEMIRTGASLGGEQSGHTIFAASSTAGDGTLTSLKIAEVMQRRGVPLSELAKEFVRFPQRLINVAVRSKPELSTVPSIADAISSTESELGQAGRVLVRYSGTENKTRVMVECEDEKSCERYAQKIAKVIEKEIGAV